MTEKHDTSHSREISVARKAVCVAARTLVDAQKPGEDRRRASPR